VTEFDSVIPPGGAGKVTASIDSTKFKGPVTKSVTVTSNDPKNARVSLRLKADIMVPVDVRPRDRVYLSGKASALEPQELMIVAMNGQPFNILEVKKREDSLNVVITPAPESAEKRADGTVADKGKAKKGAVAGGYSAYKAVVSVSDKAKVGRLADVIQLVTDHPKAGTVEIRVNGKIDGNINVRPTALYFLGSTSAKPTTSQELRLTQRPEGGLKITKVSSDNPDFTAELSAVEEGMEYLIKVDRLASSTGRAQGKLLVSTNDPLQPTIEVPIVAR
jgi:hypothetical protein